MPTLDEVLRATEGGARVVSEEHDSGKIRVDDSSLGWDWCEYGFRSREAAIAAAKANGGLDRLRAAGLARARLNVGADGRIAMMAVGELPWHGLGVLLDQAATAQEAIRYANLAQWDLQKVQQWIDFCGVKIEVPGCFAIVRGDTGKVLGSVGSQYKIVPNEECFAFMDAVIQGGARYETAGAIGDGQKVWMLARMPERVEVAPGDEVESFIMFSTSHDGSASIAVYPTSVRTVCNNTLRLAEQGRCRGIRMRHTSNVKRAVAEAQEALGLARERFSEFTEQAGFLARAKLEPAEYFASVLDDILDVTVAEQQVTAEAIREGTVLQSILEIQDTEQRASEEKRYERAVRRRERLLADILDRYESDRNNGREAIRGTAWAAANAVTECVDHSDLWRSVGEDNRTRAEHRFERLLTGWGDSMKQTAFATASAMAN